MLRGNVYVADRGNKRIQVFDGDGAFKRQITNVGAPWAICISPGAHQYLYSSNSNDDQLHGRTAKSTSSSSTARSSASSARAGKLPKEFGTVNQIDCRNPNELLVGEITNWRVQRLRLK